MDTKSKSSHKLGIFLTVLVIVGAAVAMVGLYPFFQSESVKYQKPLYERTEFLRSLVAGNYVLNVEQMEQELGAVIPPFTAYFPQADSYHEEAEAGDGGEAAGAGGAEPGAAGEAGGGDAEPGAAGEAGGGGAEPGAAGEAGGGGAEPGAAGEAGGGGAESVSAGEAGMETVLIDENGDVVVVDQEGIVEDGQPAAADVDTVLMEDFYASEYQQYIQSLKMACNREFGLWNNRFDSVRKYLDYQVLSPNGWVLLDYAHGRDLKSAEDYAFKVIMNYDEYGNLSLSSVQGENTQNVMDALVDLGTADPMDEFYWDQFRYNPEVTFTYPKQLTFIYAMSQEGMRQYGEGQTDSWFSYYEWGGIARIFTGLLTAVSLIMLLLSCLPATRVEGLKLLHIPLEIVVIAVLCAMAFGYSLVGLVAMTNQGRLYDGLLRANFLPKAAALMVKLWNVMWWCVPFAVISWGVLSVKDIFLVGFWAYVRERTLVGICWTWVSKKWRQFYDAMLRVDLRDPSDRPLWKIVIINFLVLSIICSLWFFGIGALVIYSLLLFMVLKKYYTDLRSKYRSLLHATGQIAEGNLDVVITEDLGVFEPFNEEIQKIQRGFKVAVEEEVKSQNMKTDLITNVSHDLKTPLTAIITYVNLLKDESATPEQRHSYIDVLEQKSMRLKALIEDLFEISKATSNNVTLNLVDVDIVSLLKEVSLELGDKIEESSIDFRWSLPEEKIILPLDSQKTYRIFDNLLTNVIKYAMPHTRAYVEMKKQKDSVVITIKNVSASELDHMNPNDLTDRFVRGDQARNTEGSGLGLAIAKSFVELQKGKMEIEVEADLFRVRIWWPLPAEVEL